MEMPIARESIAVVVRMVVAASTMQGVFLLLRLHGLRVPGLALASVLVAWLIRQWFKVVPSFGLTPKILASRRDQSQWYLEVMRCAVCKREFQAIQLSSSQYKKYVRDGVCRCAVCISHTNDATVNSPRSTTAARHRYRDLPSGSAASPPTSMRPQPTASPSAPAPPSTLTPPHLPPVASHNASSADTASSTDTVLGSVHYDGGPTAGEPAQHGVRIDGTMDGSMDGTMDGTMDGSTDAYAYASSIPAHPKHQQYGGGGFDDAATCMSTSYQLPTYAAPVQPQAATSSSATTTSSAAAAPCTFAPAAGAPSSTLAMLDPFGNAAIPMPVTPFTIAAGQLTVPPFDHAAMQRSKRIAAKSGKPKTREEGLKAIHAVLHKGRFATERAAWEAYGVSKQRFYEWKKVDPAKLDRSAVQPSAATDPDPPANAASMEVDASGWMGDEPFDEEEWRAWWDVWHATASTKLREQPWFKPKHLGLLVTPDWVKEHTPNLVLDEVGPTGSGRYNTRSSKHENLQAGVIHLHSPQLSPRGRHFTRGISVEGCIEVDDCAPPLPGWWLRPQEGGGIRHAWNLWQPEIEYDCPPDAGEDSTAAKQRDDRHRDREMRALRQLDGLIIPNQDPSQAADAVHRQQQRQRMAALREPPDQPQQEGGGGIALDAPFEMDPSQLDEEEGTGTCMPDNCSYFYQEQPSEWDEVYHPHDGLTDILKS